MSSSTSLLLRTFLLLLASLSLLGSTESLAQTGTIEGRIIDATTRTALPDVNVVLAGTTLGAATDQAGAYMIENVPVGTYTLTARSVGYDTEERTIRVQPGRTLTARFALSPADAQLAEVVVEGRAANAFDAPVSAHVAKMPLANIDNPQVYQTITSDLLRDQVVTSFEEALANAPGLFKLWESTGRGDDGAGYYAMRGFYAQPKMVNGLPALTNTTLDPAGIERIEVIKGPSGALYGSSFISYGGFINVVTKRPHEAFGGEVSYKHGGFGLNRATTDVNAPLGDRIAARLIGAYHNEDSFQDAGLFRSVFAAPSLALEASDRVSFLVQGEYYDVEQTNPTMLFLNRSAQLAAGDLESLGYDPERSYTSDDLTISNPTARLQGQMHIALSDRWTSQTAVSASSAGTDGYYTYLWDFADGAGTFGRYLSLQNATTRGLDVQQNFLGRISAAGLRHDLLVGLDFLTQRVEDNSSNWVGFGAITLQQPTGGDLSRSAASAALADATTNDTRTEQRVYSAYVADVVELLPQLSAMASLRLDRFDSRGDVTTEDDDYAQTALSPKLGLVYQPVPDRVSLFANYLNGFSNVAPRVQGDGSSAVFSPEQADQWEVGVKTDLYGGRLSTTLSYYDITVSNVVRQDPNRVNFYVQDGENYSRGVEASVTAAPVPGLRLIAGFSHNESEVVVTDNDAFAGRRPEGAGPRTLVNAWVSYQVPDGVLEGLGFGFGGNYASENLILNRATTGTFALPAYTLVNASVFYAADAFRVDLKISNLTDVTYYNGWTTINPQLPRRATASFAYRF